MQRTSFSLKQMAMPSCVAMMRFIVPSVRRTSISSSPSSSVRARMPPLRLVLMAVSATRLTVPPRVMKVR